MGEFENNMAKIRKRMLQWKAEKYRITNPGLLKAEDYPRMLYLKILCTVIQYHNAPTDMQIFLLERIHAGIQEEKTCEDYLHMALDVSETDLWDFLTQYRRKKEKYYFALDALLLTALGERNSENYEYLSEIMELLEIEKIDLEYLCTVAKSILLQDCALYNEAESRRVETNNDSIAGLDFSAYMRDYYVGAVVNNDTKIHYLAPRQEFSQEIEYQSFYTQRNVIFENLEITMNMNWTFKGCETVSFINCSLKGGEQKLILDSVGTFSMEGCRVERFRQRVAKMSGGNSLMIRNCEFNLCGYDSEEYSAYGGLFYWNSSENNQLVLVNNKLLNCFIKGGEYASDIFLRDNGRGVWELMDVENNEFIGGSCFVSSSSSASTNVSLYKNKAKQAYIDQVFTKKSIIYENECIGKVRRVFADDKMEEENIKSLKNTVKGENKNL